MTLYDKLHQPGRHPDAEFALMHLHLALAFVSPVARRRHPRSTSSGYGRTVRSQFGLRPPRPRSCAATGGSGWPMWPDKTDPPGRSARRGDRGGRLARSVAVGGCCLAGSDQPFEAPYKASLRYRVAGAMPRCVHSHCSRQFPRRTPPHLTRGPTLRVGAPRHPLPPGERSGKRHV